MRKKPPIPLFRSLQLGLAILAGLFIYAYGFQVTQVNLSQIQEPTRQVQLTRVLRALARPDILQFEQREVQVEAPIYVPCPSGEPGLPPPDTSRPYLKLTPSCADPRTDLHVDGFHMVPGARGQIFFVPPSQVTLNLGEVNVDSQGHFTVDVRVPPRPEQEVQHILVITQERTGSLHFTRTAKETWDKILETIFLALLATTVGTLLAIPLSFLAAKNIMKDITSILSGLSLAAIGWPLGIWIGAWIAGRIGELSRSLPNNSVANLAGILIGWIVIFILVRWAIPPEEGKPAGWGLRTARLIGLLLAALFAIFTLFLLAYFAIAAGNTLAVRLGGLSFLGSFISTLGQILNAVIVILAALLSGGLLSGAAGRFGKTLLDSLSVKPGLKQGLNILLAMMAGALLLALLGSGLSWLYEVNQPTQLLLGMGGVGAALGLILALVTRKVDVLPIGLSIYYVTRTILNALRAIEALILAIVFAVWVGIGPFAGVLALSLHTIAALGKLYSEQVESISTGPLEAVKATGANRLQTIVYAVIPQIIPPYISFTMYRWDINVRMSTIIGFAGGGGIGFLLQQNINVLNYRAASAQMLAIAIVVALMDFLSSYLRERVV